MCYLNGSSKGEYISVCSLLCEDGEDSVVDLLFYDFMKHIQCVLARFPEIWPKIGFSGVSFKISPTFISVSFHLKIRNPPGLRTLKHSENPFLSRSFQSLYNAPYFICCHPVGAVFQKRQPYMSANFDFFPRLCTRCGGSKTTMENDSSS